MSARKNGAVRGPRVSVVMSCFRGAAHLEAAVASVLGQTLEDLELIVVDDASDDDSPAILDRMAAADDRLVAVSLSQNRGPGGARNVALDRARGDWVAVVDSDDLLHPDRLHRLVLAAEATGADMVADDLLMFGAPDSAGRTLLAGRGIVTSLEVDPATFVASDTGGSGTSSLGYLKPMIRRQTLGATRYDETLRIGEDFDFVFRLLVAGAALRVLPDPAYLYRRHAGSISHRLTVSALEQLLDAQRRACEEAVALRPQDSALRDALADRTERLTRALRYQRLVAALKARRAGAAARLLGRHPALVRNLLESLRDRQERRAAAEPDDAAPEALTLVLGPPERVSAMAAPAGALRLAVPVVHAPGTGDGRAHAALACRIVELAESRALEVIAEGAAAEHVLGHVPDPRAVRVAGPSTDGLRPTV